MSVLVSNVVQTQNVLLCTILVPASVNQATKDRLTN